MNLNIPCPKQIVITLSNIKVVTKCDQIMINIVCTTSGTLMGDYQA